MGLKINFGINIKTFKKSERRKERLFCQETLTMFKHTVEERHVCYTIKEDIEAASIKTSIH